ncbi:hypothetical protein MPTK1_6g17270 [Marchantia polymorpha subsp. ruderalis]|nr:hypothetical protein MARPO_0184s0023 [Marchantia polymorpha]BBN15127.1 hypothetical protein Mp_6g17270 [Marchantia polymorpha subsp. ruderalis]|eukprot:PTQ27785.1 hypothetical protein MARPO_0184s0023 [Marchantia polymorpha]
MEAVGRAAALQSQCVVAVERVSAAAGPVPFRASTSSAECCCSLRSRLGLAGSGLSQRSRRASRLCVSTPRPKGGRSSRAPPSAAAPSAPVAILQEEPLFSSIEAHDLERESPALLAQCADMDWRRLVDELHSQALHSLESAGPKALHLRKLEKEMNSWIHDSMAEDIDVPLGGPAMEDMGWSYESAAEELRMQANLQAAQHLARGVDTSFDWENEAAELHRRVFTYGGAETPEAMKPEQRLLHAWFQFQGEEVDSSSLLAQEALSSISTVDAQDWQLLGCEDEEDSVCLLELQKVSSASSDDKSTLRDKSWLGLGAALAASIGLQGASAMDAMGLESVLSIQPNPESAEAASRAPSWLVPTVLAFPVVSYFAFNLYRDKYNPRAKVTDWMFSVVTVVIVANIVLMATLGVRLY